ncbi:MAG: sugar transporter subunit [Desulfomicrobiaceae bacterium]|jgi:PTS system mannose-specific IIA component|nr:PTS sugar transporter subunit IIA [Desulfomicrobiaceae bacterium]MBZ4648143.1 sugar transporter subunit [Desulfomicrobiaceae bacterium]MBZ4685151.1 sugar transporter subunit [Desulfomicrobiaceae bacterium]MDI3492122.1 mannose system component [Desulfomicrobiaceae bacterium]MDK2872467.1 mannose system component [Desulfomicrobiaceae bacterium]
MIGVLLVTHGTFGEHLLDAAQTILGPQEGCAVVAVDDTRPMDTILGDIKDHVRRLDRGNGVLILTDMFGGTPSNLSLSLLLQGKVEVVSGVNLPLLLKALTNRSGTLHQVALEAKSAGKQGILVAGEVLRRKVSE